MGFLLSDIPLPNLERIESLLDVRARVVLLIVSNFQSAGLEPSGFSQFRFQERIRSS